MTTKNKLSAEDRLSKAKVALMSNQHTVAYSGILMLGKSMISEDMPTAGTNGLDTWYGREFVDSLSDEELRAIVLHEEGGHKMYRHFLTWKPVYDWGVYLVEKDPNTGEEVTRCNLANIAADYQINLDIHDIEKATNGFVKLPKHALLDEKYRGMSVGQIAKLIMQENPPQSGGGGGSGKGGPGDRECKGLGNGQKPLDDHDWEHGQGMTDQEKAELSVAVDGAIRQGAILAGKMEGNTPRAFDQLMAPQVRWEDQLRQFVAETCKGNDMSTFRRPNRRYLQHDIYMPSTISETLKSIAIAIDTSGSIYGGVLNAFVSEAAAAIRMANPDQTDLMYWDSAVAGHEVYGKDEVDKMLSSTKPKGGGGTSPSCFVNYMHDNDIKPQCVIVLSDGYVGNDWGETTHKFSCPVLWVLVDNPSCTAPNGQTIHISSESYRD